MNKFLINKKTLFLSALLMVAPTAMAAGGLDVGTDAVDEIRTWFYSFLGAVSLGYIAWNCFLAMNDKQQWNEVMAAVAKVAIAGGSILCADWAWTLWGS